MSKLNNSGSGTQPLPKDPNSKRSARRANRGFQGLEKSSRKHRRAFRRLGESCNIGNGKHVAPGEKQLVRAGLSDWMHTGGGKMKYH